MTSKYLRIFNTAANVPRPHTNIAIKNTGICNTAWWICLCKAFKKPLCILDFSIQNDMNGNIISMGVMKKAARKAEKYKNISEQAIAIPAPSMMIATRRGVLKYQGGEKVHWKTLKKTSKTTEIQCHGVYDMFFEVEPQFFSKKSHTWHDFLFSTKMVNI